MFLLFYYVGGDCSKMLLTKGNFKHSEVKNIISVEKISLYQYIHLNCKAKYVYLRSEYVKSRIN